MQIYWIQWLEQYYANFFFMEPGKRSLGGKNNLHIISISFIFFVTPLTKSMQATRVDAPINQVTTDKRITA